MERLFFVAISCILCGQLSAAPWKRHVIDASSKGADGVRLADANGDGLPDIATGWEQGGTVRVCRNPGPAKAKTPWPSVTVGRASDVEDAVLVDLDGDGALDVVSCSEGKTRQLWIHWAPKSRADYLDAAVGMAHSPPPESSPAPNPNAASRGPQRGHRDEPELVAERDDLITKVEHESSRVKYWAPDPSAMAWASVVFPVCRAPLSSTTGVSVMARRMASLMFRRIMVRYSPVRGEFARSAESGDIRCGRTNPESGS